MEKDLTGKTFELITTGFLRYRYDVDAEHNVKLRGRSGILRQLDVSGLNSDRNLIVGESKDYGKKLDIGYVDRFDGFLDDVGAAGGVLFSAGGFTRGAVKRAETARIPIELAFVQYGQSRTPDEMFNEDFCPNPNCGSQDIGWGYNISDGLYITAGTCDYCGTVVVVCPICGTLNGEHVSSIQCDECGFEVNSEHEWWDAGDARITVIG
ncbi:restriction endonuclease [Streptomyces sp. NPDC051554]|uniref:restriction endonuclease n=1 Tax=Streptomyces sp. NPDC051554 TaxID=3365656 RepID=UPI00379809A2